MERNETLMQYFEWYLPADCGHWRRTAAAAGRVGRTGDYGGLAAARL